MPVATTDYKRLNPSAQSRCLELDNGLVLAEITAFCSYLDEIFEGASLIGDTPERRAETRMWNRRIDVRILELMPLAFRSAEGLGLFKDRCHVIADAADDLKATVQENWAWLEPLMADKTFVCGERLALADIQLYCFVDFSNMLGQGIPADLPNLHAWFARFAERPGVMASFNPSGLEPFVDIAGGAPDTLFECVGAPGLRATRQHHALLWPGQEIADPVCDRLYQG